MFGVVFDCDGVLLDSMSMWHTLDDKLAARAGVEFTDEDRDFLTAGTLEECSRYMHEKYALGDSTEHVMQMILDDMYEFYTTVAKPKPGAMELVQALAAEGVPMAVASSTPQRLLKAGLEATGFVPYMQAIFSVDELGTSKREPVVFDAAAAAIGCDRNNAWVVEDSTYALKTVRAAGFRTLAVHDNDISGAMDDLKATSDICISSLTEIGPDVFSL